MMPRATRATVALAVAALAATLSGCGASPIIPKRVADAVAPTFANLYVLQQSVRGRQVTAKQLNAKATCARGGPTTPDRGPGSDWSCNVTWFDTATSIAVIATYTVRVQANGCYTADGDGPVDVNGQQTIVSRDGVSVTNPLYEFDGCFDLG